MQLHHTYRFMGSHLTGYKGAQAGASEMVTQAARGELDLLSFLKVEVALCTDSPEVQEGKDWNSLFFWWDLTELLSVT